MMGTLHDLIRAAKRATILEVARARHQDHINDTCFGKYVWWHAAAVQARRAMMEGSHARLQLRRYLKMRKLPTEHPCVPKTPIT